MSNFRHIRFQNIEETDLLDFIVSKHHVYAKSMLLLMHKNFKSAIYSNPRHRAVLQDLICLVVQLNNQINGLINLQESSLFPFVRKLVEVQRQPDPVRFLNTGLMLSCINQIIEEHDHIIALLHSIQKISNNYTPPELSNELMKLCYAELQEFEEIVMNQLKRERKFLFPKIKALEDCVLQISSLAATGTSGPGYDD
ncbi:MAG: hypothetical protein WED33_12920 [Bacteroidia bacterium]